MVNPMEKKMENEMETGIIWGILGSVVFFWRGGYYGTQYRVRLYSAFGV